jgi:hypothetical protein
MIEIVNWCLWTQEGALCNYRWNLFALLCLSSSCISRSNLKFLFIGDIRAITLCILTILLSSYPQYLYTIWIIKVAKSTNDEGTTKFRCHNVILSFLNLCQNFLWLFVCAFDDNKFMLLTPRLLITLSDCAGHKVYFLLLLLVHHIPSLCPFM